LNLIKVALDRPIAVVAAVLMVILFGLVSLQTIPIQLAPDVRRPVLSVTTNWRGAAPAEVEREIVNRQEEVIKGLVGLQEMTSASEDGRGRITLEFAVTQDMDKALLLLGNRLDRVDSYPDEADEPFIRTSGTEDNPIAWFILRRIEGNTREMHTFGDLVEDTVQDRLERVAGVSRVNVYGGSERELRVVVDPEKMARYGLTVPNVVDAMRRANASISAGDVEEGKRRYVVRTEGELNSVEQVRAVALRSEADTATGRVARVTVGDIAEVGFGYKDPTARIRMQGEQALAVNAVGETGANVIETMKGIRAAVEDLEAAALPDAGLNITQVYDETLYINSAISLVQQNIIVGGALAALVLLLFLRSGRATLVVSIAIPVSVIGSFVAMAALGRSINVISLAGLAFAVGMVVDAAIVVLENIYRLRSEGHSRWQAAFEGASQVWGAVLVSALTTVMVFIPILVMELEVGQLFRDIAVAISVSVLLSLLVAVTLIPALSNRLFGAAMEGTRKRMRIPVIDWLAESFVRFVLAFVRGVVRSRALALGVVCLVIGAGAAVTLLFLPKLEYLPEGNRNLIFGIILPPPGYNLETTTGIARDVEDAVRPFWASETGRESKPGEPPKMERFFFVALRSRTFLGAASVDPTRAGELIPVLQKRVFTEPGTFGFITQRSLFGRGIGGGNLIRFDISGPRLEENLSVAVRAVGMISQAMPRAEGYQLRPIPGLELGAPEVRVIPDRLRLADSGVTARELGETVDAFNDGLRVAEVTADGRRVDLMLMGPVRNISQTQGIENLPVVTRSGHILPANSLADIQVTSGPTEIRHLERERTVTIEIRPAPGVPLESAMETLRNEIMTKLREQGLPPGIKLGLSGTAKKLEQTWEAMKWDLGIAVIIVFLVMAVLFESFIYPFIIVLSVPLATAGGVLGLALVNIRTFQPLDMLTLLGFVILIGIVVNNAILLVHQTLLNIRKEGMAPGDAIVRSTQTRIRPIFMSTLTSVFGMLPLVVIPGAGSELYRGLGSVVVGGLALSAVLTLAIIPPLLSMTVGIGERSHARDPARTAPAPGE
jgi:HAE1 family hydrophobic/amphiphilic exporter-1